MARERKRRRSTAEYKAEAVERLEESGKALRRVAAELGVYTPRTSGKVERFDGRVWREVPGITVASHRDLERLLAGFGSAYDTRRQRVLAGRSPEEVGRERPARDHSLANPDHRPPSGLCALPRALPVVERADEVPQPDSQGPSA